MGLSLIVALDWIVETRTQRNSGSNSDEKAPLKLNYGHILGDQTVQNTPQIRACIIQYAKLQQSRNIDDSSRPINFTESI